MYKYFQFYHYNFQCDKFYTTIKQIKTDLNMKFQNNYYKS